MLLIDCEDGFAVISGPAGRDAPQLSLDLLSHLSASGVEFVIGGKSEDVVMTIHPRDADASHQLRTWWTMHARGAGTTVSLAARVAVASDRLDSLRRAVDSLIPTNGNARIDEQVELLAALRLIEPDGALRYRLTELGAACLARLDRARLADQRRTPRIHKPGLMKAGRG